MIAYFETSAFLKLLLDERGADTARQLWEERELAVSSALLAPEARAASAAAARAGRLGGRAASATVVPLLREVELLLPTFDLLERAGELAETYGLRGYDVVHLASAEALPCDVLVTSDADLVTAAPQLGIAVADVRA